MVLATPFTIIELLYGFVINPEDVQTIHAYKLYLTAGQYDCVALYQLDAKIKNGWITSYPPGYSWFKLLSNPLICPHIGTEIMIIRGIIFAMPGF